MCNHKQYQLCITRAITPVENTMLYHKHRRLDKGHRSISLYVQKFRNNFCKILTDFACKICQIYNFKVTHMTYR